MEERRRETDFQFLKLTEKVELLAEKLSHKLTGIAVEQAEIKKDVSHTLAQVLKTNGRVNELEEDLDNLDSDYRDSEKRHEAIFNKCLGWSVGVTFMVGILIKLFWK